MKQREIILDMGKAAFFVLAVKVLASSSSLIPWNSFVDNLCIVFAVGVMLVKVCTMTLTLGRLLSLGAVSLVVLYTCVALGQYDLMVSLVAICLLIDEDIDAYISMVFRMQSVVVVGHVAVAILMSLAGAEDMFWRVSGGRLRFNGGLSHANVLSGYITSCMMMFAWIRFNQITRNQWGWLSLVTVLSYAVSRSRTGLMLNVLLLLLVYVAQKDSQLLRRSIKPILFLLFPTLAAFVFWAMKQYLSNSSVAVFVDDLLTGRIKYAAYAYTRSGTTWLPRYLEYAEKGVVSWTPEWRLNTFAFDNLYSFIFVQMGIIWIILFTVAVAVLCLKSNFKIRVFVLVWVLFAMTEVRGLNGFKFFPILLFSTLFSREGTGDEPDG